MRIIRFFLHTLCAVVAISVALAAQAQQLANPSGDVILTIKGDMVQRNIPDGAAFDLQMLKEIGMVTFSTTTPWTDGIQSFTGVPLNRLLAQIGAAPTVMTVTAINEYQVQVPASDAIDGGPILAWDQSGKMLSIREKGPLWLMYPFDSKSEYRTEKVHARAVWQVAQIDLLP